ncbi:MAG: hypothetical protein ACQEVA_14100 [Myxococcota bacterium]
MASDSKRIVHRGVALMICENEAILEETLLSMDTSPLHIDRISDRAIVAPAYELEKIREQLQERGTYPKVVGDIVRPEDLEPDEEQADADAEGEDSEDADDTEEDS